MIIPDKKKTVSMILGRMKPDGTDSTVEGKAESEMDPGDESLKAIAEDVMTAIKEGSAHDLMTALQAFVASADQGD